MRKQFVLALAALLLAGSFPHRAAAQAAAPQAAPPGIEPLRFAAEIEAFEKEDKAAMPPKGAIVVTGASTIRRWHPTIKEDLSGLTVVPRGFGGSTMEDALYWIDRLAIGPYQGLGMSRALYPGPPPLALALKSGKLGSFDVFERLLAGMCRPVTAEAMLERWPPG